MLLCDASRFGRFRRHALTCALAASCLFPFAAGCKKPLSEMSAMDVAKNPAAYGFKKGGSISEVPEYGGGEASTYDQWTNKTSDGRLYILTIHYDKNRKILDAKWGGR